MRTNSRILEQSTPKHYILQFKKNFIQNQILSFLKVTLNMLNIKQKVLFILNLKLLLYFIIDFSL